MTHPVYRGIKNTRYTPGSWIGDGGEGTVYEVKENTTLVIKVYNEAIDGDKSEKLMFMTSISNPEIRKFATWPLDAVRDNATNICGFVMDKLVGFYPLHSLFNPMERKKLFPDKGYNFLIHVARNLAIAFYKIHQLSIVIGDVNERNVLVNDNGMVSLIDCDSFQIKNGNKYYFCDGGVPGYTAPELLEEGSFNNVIRTTSTDSFSLATLIFQLLFLGRRPFTGINLTNEEIDEETAIKTKEFAYSLRRINKKLLPAKNSLGLQYLSEGIINSFHTAFESLNNRPTPSQWITALNELSKEIVPCSTSKIHYYPKKMNQCPWCTFRKEAGIVYFLDDSYLKALPELHNIEQFVNGFKIEKLEIENLSEHYTNGSLAASPIEKKFNLLKALNNVVLGVVIVTTVFACTLYSWGYIVVGVLFLLIFNSISPMKKELKRELTNRKSKSNTLKTNFQSLIKQHNNAADINKYNQSEKNLTGLISSYRNLPSEFIAKKRKIEEKHYNAKYVLHLQKFEILYSTIASFGPNRKRLIYNNGIKTAADVGKLNSMKINGIGPKNIQILNDWQRQAGSGFTYSPDYNKINADINIAANEISIKKQKLEVDIKAEYKNLLILRAQVISATDTLKNQYGDLAKKLYQSELDLKEFEKLVK